MGTSFRRVISERDGTGEKWKGVPTDDDVVVHTINLCVPRSPTFVEPGRDDASHEALEFWAAIHVDLYAVGIRIEEGKEGMGRGGGVLRARRTVMIQ